MRFLSTPFLPSKTFPCQAKWLMNRAMVGLNVVPGVVTAAGAGPAPTLVHSLDELLPARDLLPARNKYFIGLLDPAVLPVAGVATAKKLVDESLPSNTLMARCSIIKSFEDTNIIEEFVGRKIWIDAEILRQIAQHAFDCIMTTLSVAIIVANVYQSIRWM